MDAQTTRQPGWLPLCQAGLVTKAASVWSGSSLGGSL